MSTKKEIQVILIERDKITDALKKLEEGYESGQVSKLDYKILHGRYENKLREIEQKLDKPKPKPSKLGKLRFWQKGPRKKA
ncbi:MAG: hypothetical protein QMD00_02340 [Hadesarchaea archaeon]|nr:hypothetical protein [Hadesarchaea archaeon]